MAPGTPPGGPDAQARDGPARGAGEAGTAGDVAALHDSAAIRQIVEEQYGGPLCSWREVLTVLLILAFVGLATWVVSLIQDELLALSAYIQGLGAGGYALFLLLFLWVGLPFGFNWSTLVMLVGYAYGWYGVLLANLGTVVSAGLVCYATRQCLLGWAQRRMGNYSRRTRLYFLAVQQVAEADKVGFLMLFCLRMQPLLSFGMANTFIGTFANLSFGKYLATTALGCQTDIIKLVSIAVMIRGLGGLDLALQGEAGRANIIVSASVLVFVVVAAFVLMRYVVARVLPRLIEEDELVAVQARGAGAGAATAARSGNAV